MSTTSKRLSKARKQRTLIAQTFDALRNEHIRASELLQTPPQCLGRIRVYDVLRRVPHLNRDGAEKVLQHASVWPLRTMSQLTKGERQRIIRNLPPRVTRSSITQKHQDQDDNENNTNDTEARH